MTQAPVKIPAGPDRKERAMRGRLASSGNRWNQLLQLARDQRGSELVEFALSFWVLMTLLFALIFFSFGMYSYVYAANAAQEGTQFATVRGGTWTTACNTSAPPSFIIKYDCTASTTDVQNYLRANTPPGIVPSQVSVTTSWPGTTATCNSSCTACTSPNTAQSKGCMVKVVVSYNYLLFPTLLRTTLTTALQSTSERTIAQ